MENKSYKPIVKQLSGYDVRVIKVDDYHEYIICKDIFDVLGLAKDEFGINPKKNVGIFR